MIYIRKKKPSQTIINKVNEIKRTEQWRCIQNGDTVCDGGRKADLTGNVQRILCCDASKDEKEIAIDPTDISLLLI